MMASAGVGPTGGSWRASLRAGGAIPWWLRRILVVGLGAAVPVGAAVAVIPARSGTPNASVALGLAVLVSLIAATTDRLTAAVAAVAAAVSFDVWFTHPYGSVTISGAQDVETTVLLLAVAMIVGQVAARSRLHRRWAVETSCNLGRVHAVAEMVAAGASADQVVLAVTIELRSLLRLRACWFDEAFAEHPGAFIERNGAVSWGAIRWGFSTLGLPTKEISLMVEHDGLPLGRFVLVASPGVRVTEDELVTAVALSDQAGAALGAHHRLAS